MQMRTSKPGAGNKFYITKGAGGYSTCIVGKPTDANCNVLANCVGYACGRFNEIIGSMKYPALNCNAENFIERAISLGLQVVSKPTLGGIMVFGGNGDLAGHVAIVERIDSANQIYTSESGYGSTAFWNQIRTNNNGKWGIGSNYTYRGCIVNPAIGYKPYEPTPTPTPTPGPSSKFNVGDKVVISGVLYVSSNAASPSGSVSEKVTTITRKADGAAHPYNTSGDLGWMDESSIRAYSEPTPQPTPTPSTGLNIGDTVKIVGYGNADSYGSGGRAGGIGWTRQILDIKPGRSNPYRVGNNSGTTGWYPASSLQKL